MPKNILICCDGTADEYARDITNVRRTTHVAVRDADQVTRGASISAQGEHGPALPGAPHAFHRDRG